jgi:hypothetical protein
MIPKISNQFDSVKGDIKWENYYLIFQVKS